MFESDTIFVAAVVLMFIIILSGCAMLYFLLRNSRLGGSSSVPQTDLTNQMILFQSMRETVEQQKELARQLNFSIDKKVQDIREIIESASRIDTHISGAEEKLDTLMANTKEELKSLNRRLGYIRDQAGISEPEPPQKIKKTENPDEPEIIAEVVEVPVASVIDAQGNEIPYDGNDQLPPLNAIAANFKEKRDFVDNWTGIDFGVQQLEEPAVVVEPEEPEEAEASRDAFRTLLNMKSGSANGDFIEESMSTEQRDEELSPVQRRIYEFSDAGMRIPDIARELGVGKGEVKLILSMRGTQA